MAIKAVEENLAISMPIALPAVDPAERETILRVMSAAAFLIFFQSYLVAPLIPALAREFRSAEQIVGLLVPAYLLPYGISTLFYGPLSDRIGRRPILLFLLAMLAIATAGAATARSIPQLIAWRIAGGVTSGGIIPIALALFGDLFPYEQRGRPLGWIFGAIAGGSAFGSTFGAILYRSVGWRAEFVAVGLACVAVFLIAFRHRALLDGRKTDHPLGLKQIVRTYLSLLGDPRGGRTYAWIFLNGVFHSGIFAWLGVYFSQRFGLGEVGIGLALLGYGVPGLCLGPMIGHIADRVGRRAIIPLGMCLAACCAFALAPHLPLALAAITVTALSLGFDMSHPLLAGIITSLDPKRRGAAMGINAFVLFTGFGLGSLIFQGVLRSGFTPALVSFASVQLVLGILAFKVFRSESSDGASARH
ncbi:MAG: MFS transporter [Tepidisphaeraceae bacterium]